MNAIISGATKGIGRSIVFELAQMGYSLALGARSKNDLWHLKQELDQLYPSQKFLIKECDFAVKKEIEDFSSYIKTEFGTIHVIVNNVGNYHVGTISSDRDGVLEEMLNINLYSAYYLSRYFLDSLKNQKSGYIFTICSITSLHPRMNAAAYSISKAALLSFSRLLSEEMRDFNVKVTAIIPGSVNTSSWDGIQAPKKQFIQPQDIAKTISACLSMSPSALFDEIIIKPIDKNL